MKYKLPRNATDALRTIGHCEFRTFDKLDFDAFAGVQTDSPVICYLVDNDNPEEGMVVIREILPNGNQSYYFEVWNEDLESDYVDFLFKKGVE